MVDVDRLVSRIRGWFEDRLPWYDREEEQAAEERTEDIRQRSIAARITAEEVRLRSYQRARLHR